MVNDIPSHHGAANAPSLFRLGVTRRSHFLFSRHFFAVRV
jgi:hypothetical protein